jgi:hypothetical protein
MITARRFSRPHGPIGRPVSKAVCRGLEVIGYNLVCRVLSPPSSKPVGLNSDNPAHPPAQREAPDLKCWSRSISIWVEVETRASIPFSASAWREFSHRL